MRVPGIADLRRLISGNRDNLLRLGLTMAAAVLSRAGQLALVVVVARKLGPTDFGVFIFAIGASVISGMIGAMGWPTSFNRFFSLARRSDDPGLLRGVMTASRGVVVTGSVVTALILLGASRYTDELEHGMIAGAFLTVPLALTLLRRQQLAGVGQSPFALLLDQGFASLALFGLLLVIDLTLYEMLAVYAAALIAGNFIAGRIVDARLPEGWKCHAPTYQLADWMKSSLSLLVGQAARLLLTRFDVILLPALAGLAQAGLYGAGLRVTYVLSFPQFILQTITGPLFAEAYAARDFGRARKLLLLSMVFAFATTLPMMAIILVVPEWIMVTLFGEGFRDGALPLVLTSLGTFAFSLGMPFGTILAMAGREKAFGILNLAVLALSLALAFALMPGMGATGAGYVTLASGLVLLFGQIGLSLRVLREPGAR
ncbi:MAG: oligosaccharide flippase family protein [Novosphingobium sp.]|nr:oligosaccharide flippase family protein [Novosphingobium sp.]